jgi:hypothetical protein
MPNCVPALPIVRVIRVYVMRGNRFFRDAQYCRASYVDAIKTPKGTIHKYGNILDSPNNAAEYSGTKITGIADITENTVVDIIDNFNKFIASLSLFGNGIAMLNRKQDPTVIKLTIAE